MNKYTVYTSTVCRGGGEYGPKGGPQTDKTLAAKSPSNSLIFLRCAGTTVKDLTLTSGPVRRASPPEMDSKSPTKRRANIHKEKNRKYIASFTVSRHYETLENPLKMSVKK